MPTAEIIRERPASAIPEVAFDAFGNCLWVLFEDDEYRQWCGIFGAGDLHYEGKLQRLRSDDFLVLVAGRLYRGGVARADGPNFGWHWRVASADRSERGCTGSQRPNTPF